MCMRPKCSINFILIVVTLSRSKFFAIAQYPLLLLRPPTSDLIVGRSVIGNLDSQIGFNNYPRGQSLEALSSVKCHDGSTLYSFRSRLNDFHNVEAKGKAILSLDCASHGLSGSNICICTPTRTCYRGNNTGMSVQLASYCTKGLISLCGVYVKISGNHGTDAFLSNNAPPITVKSQFDKDKLKLIPNGFLQIASVSCDSCAPVIC